MKNYEILSKEKGAAAEFIEAYMPHIAMGLPDLVHDDPGNRQELYHSFNDEALSMYSILGKIRQTVTGKEPWGDPTYDKSRIELTEAEANALCLAIDISLLELVREDCTIDNVRWIGTLCNLFDRLDRAIQANTKSEKTENEEAE